MHLIVYVENGIQFVVFLISDDGQSLTGTREPNEAILEQIDDERALSALEQENMPTRTSYDLVTVVFVAVSMRQKSLRADLCP